MWHAYHCIHSCCSLICKGICLHVLPLIFPTLFLKLVDLLYEVQNLVCVVINILFLKPAALLYQDLFCEVIKTYEKISNLNRSSTIYREKKWKRKNETGMLLWTQVIYVKINNLYFRNTTPNWSLKHDSRSMSLQCFWIFF